MPAATSSKAGARTALAVFVAVELAFLPLLLDWGRRGWFFNDDWDFLASRSAGSLGGLFRSHFDHWTTLPVLVYRLLWTIVGVHSYVPYVAVLIALHLVAAALLRAVMRRAGVGPWISTVAACVFVLFGSGAENVLVAFQITFVGAFVFGLVHLLLADHDGPVDLRDWLGLLAGLAGLMCSGVALTMTAIVGLAVLLRRGWRPALLHTGPLGLIYLLWYLTAPRGRSAQVFHANSPGTVARFVVIGVQATFGDLGRIPGVGIALAALLVVGLAIAYRAGRRELTRRAAAPIALLAGALIFLVLTGVYRSAEIGGAFFRGTGPEHARQSRYVYLVAALALPTLALAADAVLRRWRGAGIVAIAVLLAGVPGNVTRFSHYTDRFVPVRALEQGILAVPGAPLAHQLPPSLRLTVFGAPDATVGWVLDSAEAGRLPGPAHPSPTLDASVTLQLALQPAFTGRRSNCRALRHATTRVLSKGDSITIVGAPAYAVYVAPGGGRSLPRRLPPGTYEALAGPLRLVLSPPAQPAGPTELCV